MNSFYEYSRLLPETSDLKIQITWAGCRSELADSTSYNRNSFLFNLPTSIKNHEPTSNMSAQAAGRAVNAATKAASKSAGDHVLNKGAKRDPELYVCTH
jgi:hypothetical protein